MMGKSGINVLFIFCIVSLKGINILSAVSFLLQNGTVSEAIGVEITHSHALLDGGDTV